MKKNNDYKEGKFIYAQVIVKPSTCEAINSRTSYIKVLYSNKVYVKKIGHSFCNDIEKDSLKMIISKDKTTIFFPHESDSFQSNIISCICLVIISLFCNYKINKNEKK